MCPSALKAAHSDWDSSHAIKTYKRVRAGAGVCAGACEVKVGKSLCFIAIGRYGLEIRRQYYCTGFLRRICGFDIDAFGVWVE